MKQENLNEIRFSSDTISELLTITYLKSQNLTGKTVSEFIEIYENTLQEIATIRHNHANKDISEGLENYLNDMHLK